MADRKKTDSTRENFRAPLRVFALKIRSLTDLRFFRSQLSALAATALDISVLFFCTEILRVYYVASVALGALSGAILNFTLGRHWAFGATRGAIHRQMVRYLIVSFGSLLLNTGGVAFFTEVFGIHYGLSKAIVAVLVGFLFNYPLQRLYVFHVPPEHELKGLL